MKYLLILLSFVISVFATVDIFPVDFKENDEGFSGSVYGSVELKSGNTDKDEMDLGGRIQYDTDETVTWLKGEREKDKSKGTVTDDNAFIHLRHIHQIYNPRLAMEFYAQYKKDEFKSLRSRTAVGLGPRYKVYDSGDGSKIFFGLSVFEENVKYTNYDDDLYDENPDETNYRFSSYLSYKTKVNDTLDFSLLSYIQPKVNDLSDYAASASAELSIHLTKVIDLSYSLDYDYDTDPATGRKKDDTDQKLSFVYRFGVDDPFTNYAYMFLKSKDNAEAEDVNISDALAVEIDTKERDIKDSTDTFIGVWKGENEEFSVNSGGEGSHLYINGLYKEKIIWKIVSTQTQEGSTAAKGQRTKLVIMRFVDEEDRIVRIENYLWSEDSMVGLSGNKIRYFTR